MRFRVLYPYRRAATDAASWTRMKGLALKVPLDQIIFVRRRSPDWQGLACDYEAGMPIDPCRYKRVNVLGFPGDIDTCIRIWNDTFPANFFRCRKVLKDISERILAKSIIE